MYNNSVDQSIRLVLAWGMILSCSIKAWFHIPTDLSSVSTQPHVSGLRRLHFEISSGSKILKGLDITHLLIFVSWRQAGTELTVGVSQVETPFTFSPITVCTSPGTTHSFQG